MGRIAKACKERSSRDGRQYGTWVMNMVRQLGITFPTRKAFQHGPYVVLSDVDDTILPGADHFKIAGVDRSWALDGSLYPGVVSMHEELRGTGPDDYTILFTARPPTMCKKLEQTL